MANEKELTIDEEISRDERRARGDGVEVDITEPDDDDDPETSVDDVPGAPTRREKKQARKALRDEAEELREKSARLERELLEERAKRAEATGYAQGMRQATAGPAVDPVDAELSQIVVQKRELGEQYAAEQAAGKVTPERYKEFLDRAERFNQRQQELITDKTLRKYRPNEQQLQAQENQRQLQARYPEVTADAKALGWAKARYDQLVLEGHPPGWETTDLAMNESKSRHMPSARKPDPTMERRLQAQPRGAGAPASGGPTRVHLSVKDLEMAEAAFPKLSPREAAKAYAKVVSKKSA